MTVLRHYTTPLCKMIPPHPAAAFFFCAAEVRERGEFTYFFKFFVYKLQKKGSDAAFSCNRQWRMID